MPPSVAFCPTGCKQGIHKGYRLEYQAMKTGMPYGLKIPFPQGSVGSIPTPGTTAKREGPKREGSDLWI